MADETLGPLEQVEAQTFDGMVKVRASRLIYMLGVLDGLLQESGGLDTGVSVARLLETPSAGERA